MTYSNNKQNTAPVLTLGAEFGGLVVQGAGVRVELDSNGSVTVYSNGSVKVRPAADEPAPAAPKIGAGLPDGTVYAGLSPDTGRAMYTTPADAPLTMKWRDAMKHAAKLGAHGHKDWRLPSRAELNVLFNNRAAIGGFDTSGSFPTGHYWSSAELNGLAWNQRFSDGVRYDDYHKYYGLSVRCVRG
jgi:hypothetical protein